MRSLGLFADLLLLSRHFACRIPPAVAVGRFALAAKVGAAALDIPDLLSRALDIPWLGPGVVIAIVLLITLRGRRRVARKPLHRSFRMPHLERFRGKVWKRHQDLEI